MSRPIRLAAQALFLGVALTVLAGCTTGRTFSIAMTNPGPVTTVLVVGDVEGGAEASTDASAAVAALPSVLVTGSGRGLAARGAALVAAQNPTVLTAGTSGPVGPLAAHMAPSIAGGAPGPAVAASLSDPAPPSGAATLAAAQAGVQAPLSTPTATTVSLTTPVAAASAALTPAGGVSAQLATPVATVAATAAPQGLQVSVTAQIPVSSVPASSVGAMAALTTGGVSAQLTSPAAVVTVAAAPSQGLQLAVASPALAPVAALASSAPAGVQAVLAGPSAALSAPTPGRMTSPVSGVKTLLSVTSKLKHG